MMDNHDLKNKTALVTGATSGIGKATALALAARGARVIVSGRDATRGDGVVAAIRAAGGQADFLPANLSDSGVARDLARRATALAGTIDILVNNAGIFPAGPTSEMADAFDSVYATNVKAPYVLVGELAPKMAERGSGAIVNVSTIAADLGMNGLSLYGSSKAALNLLTKAWAAEFGPKGVRVNAVSPGPTRTEGSAAMGEMLDQVASAAPAGHPAEAEDIANTIAFLASDDARFIHGAVVAVDGGRTAV